MTDYISNVHNMSDEDEDEEIDPRVQVELDNLNGASEVINHLEILHADATTKFRSMNESAITELKLLRQTLGKCVDKSRPYYEARKIARQAQLNTQKAARAYQRANSLYEAAKDTIALAEQKLTNKDQHDLDPAWQEMLNHAIIKVYDAEREKSRTEADHRAIATRLATSEREASVLAQKLRSSIVKARPYFDRKACLEESLERKQRRLLSQLPPREPCVGAEMTESADDDVQIDIDCSDTLSVTSSQTCTSEQTANAMSEIESEVMDQLCHCLERCQSDINAVLPEIEQGRFVNDCGPDSRLQPAVNTATFVYSSQESLVPCASASRVFSAPSCARQHIE